MSSVSRRASSSLRECRQHDVKYVNAPWQSWHFLSLLGTFYSSFNILFRRRVAIVSPLAGLILLNVLLLQRSVHGYTVDKLVHHSSPAKACSQIAIAFLHNRRTGQFAVKFVMTA